MGLRSSALELANLNPQFNFLPLNGYKRPIVAWELIQNLKVLNFLQKINFVIKNYFYNFKVAAKTLYENIYYKISINWNNNKKF